MLAVTWYAVCKQENQESWWFNLVQSGSGGPEIGELQCSEIQCWGSSLKGALMEYFISTPNGSHEAPVTNKHLKHG